MKPCDCKDMFTVINQLPESGIVIGRHAISVAPSSVYLETGNVRVILPQSIFKRFAEWYLEDQGEKQP
jgi:hypothetical protein